MNEVWIPINGFEDHYEVSDCGRVRSVDRYVCWNGTVRLSKGRILQLRPDGHSYLRAALCKEGNRSEAWAHRLVAQHFISNPKGLPQVNHLDCNPQNNNIFNLEWTTQLGNMRHSVLMGRRPFGVEVAVSKLCPDIIKQIRRMNLEGETNIYIAQKFSVHATTIGRIVMGHTWKQVSS